MLLFGCGLIAIFGSSAVSLSGAGPLGCLTTATVAAYKWRLQRQPGESVCWICLIPERFFLYLDSNFHMCRKFFLVECKSVVSSLVQDDLGGVIALAWLIVQHFLFGLIGAAVDISNIQPNTAGMCDLDHIPFEKVFLLRMDRLTANLLISLKIWAYTQVTKECKLFYYHHLFHWKPTFSNNWYKVNP